MNIEQLLEGVKVNSIKHGRSSDVVSIFADSRVISGTGALFVAISGAVFDGHNEIKNLLSANKVSFVVLDQKLEFHDFDDVTMIYVPDSKVALGKIASNFYGHPSSKIISVGITGTNGKTTTSYLIESILNKANLPAGRIGTNGYDLLGVSHAAITTTPSVLELNMMLDDLHSRGGMSVVIEVSSHGLTQHRVSGIDFDVAIFTNLTQDHIDYHKNLDDYFNAKSILFRLCKPKVSIVNLDDSYANRLLSLIEGKVLTYSLKSGADIYIAEHKITTDGLSATIKIGSNSISIKSSLVGRFNLYNILAAVSFGVSQGIDYDLISSGIEGVNYIPGRFERVDEGQPYSLIIDYAHTDDALKNILTAARELTDGRLIVVFGCGGDRDRGKRAKMGKVVKELSDYIIVTSDNPRTEDPLNIVADILAGMDLGDNNNGNVRLVIDRKEAIKAAIGEATAGDTVIIAGKGHEQYQIVGQETLHFNDKEEAIKVLRSNETKVQS